METDITLKGKGESMKTEKVLISQIRIGDTVIHEGQEKTVCSSNITRDEFMGLKLWGDSYNLGYKLVERVRSW